MRSVGIVPRWRAKGNGGTWVGRLRVLELDTGRAGPRTSSTAVVDGSHKAVRSGRGNLHTGTVAAKDAGRLAASLWLWTPLPGSGRVGLEPKLGELEASIGQRDTDRPDPKSDR